MTSHLIHGLWQRSSGLHLWIEQVEGHRIVTPDDIAPGVFPDEIDAMIRGKKFWHRLNMTLLTPKGRQVRLGVPTMALAPEYAVKLLARVAALNEVTTTESQLATIASDLKWMSHLYKGLYHCVRAGRITIKLNYFEQQWYPTWQLSTGLGERGWIAHMTHACPGVLVRNSGSSVAEDMAEELPHWIAQAILKPLYFKPRATPWHDFPRALLASEPLRRGSAQVVSALNKWKESIQAVGLELIIRVEEPPRSDEEEQNLYDNADHAEWPVRVSVRSGIDQPVPVILSQFDSTTRQQLEAMRRELSFVSRYFSTEQTPHAHPTTRLNDGQGGDFDIYLSTVDLVDFIATDIKRLREAGYTIFLPKAWSNQDTKATVKVSAASESTGDRKVGMDAIVDFSWQIAIGDTTLDDKEMKELIASQSGLIKLRGEWVMADSQALNKVRSYLSKMHSSKLSSLEKERARLHQELLSDVDPDLICTKKKEIADLTARIAREASSSGRLSLQDLRELSLADESQYAHDPVEFTGSDWYLALMGKGNLPELPAPQPVKIPTTVRAQLRDYQHRGVSWLKWMSSQHLGAILADDMGLGKTLQLLTLQAIEKAEFETQMHAMRGITSRSPYGPSLVVAPTSVVGNWAKEAQKFTPELKVLVHHGPKRMSSKDELDKLAGYDLVITSYGTVSRDISLFSRVYWHRVTLDEAQHIKNSQTRTSKAVRALRSTHRLALTGTPVENRLLELRAILDFCNPGILGSVSFFRNHFAKPIEVTQDEVVAEKLKTLTQPFILRRLKSDPTVAHDLPAKTENIVTVDMTAEQAALYQAYVNELKEALSHREGMKRRGLILSSLTKIKQICNHPAHFLADNSPVTFKGKHRSGKIEELMNIVENARANDEKILVFTQYKAFGDILVPYLENYYGTDIPFLHGSVSKSGRDRMVDEFQSTSGAPAMVLSLKAGGTGLNLTQANVVVHIDRWWNPAVENQATDRAYRIGQDKNVMVYKLITAGTLEEKIQEIIEGKSALAHTMISRGEGWLTELDDSELAELLEYRTMSDGLSRED
ncbi:DEAD/DEAH box helicase [Corynebacterium sp. ES2794-CONJ1]|uniref:DEAD/DEAH box helicase n=1 Tax=Corynebacterium sp. ES2794-CONJ1 TaxID=2980553 RepID=UPI0021D9DB3D|nr:DEAD/DEAH box helicase [Corynebacterium sp. ES2794-CONJ1]MCU9519296.1 DEAD/DEAH box helicase [Corynebacterium sp. ES2794-CONJ1]